MYTPTILLAAIAAGLLAAAPSDGTEAGEDASSQEWSRTVDVAEPGLMGIDLEFRVRSPRALAPGEYLDVLMRVDDGPVSRNPYGSLLRLRSVGTDDAPLDTDWQKVSCDRHLSAGLHTVSVKLDGNVAGPEIELMVRDLRVRSVRTVAFPDDGGFVIRSGDREFRSATWVSRPGGGWHGLGSGTPPPGEAIPWQVETLRQSGNAWEGRATSDQFTLHRTIRVNDHRIEIEDTLTNVSEADLGWMVRHELVLPVDLATTAVHLGGDARRDPSPVYAAVVRNGDAVQGIDCWRPANPTVYVALPEDGLGLVIEDDVSRAHALTYTRALSSEATTVGFRDEHLALPPGGSHTMRWAVYTVPGPGRDYYDFINRVREDWNVNVHVPGPTVWSTFLPTMSEAPDAELAERLHGSGAWALASSLNGWIASNDLGKIGSGELVTIGFGPGVLDPYYAPQRERWGREAERVHRLAPGLHVLHYFHTFLYSPESGPEAYRDSWVLRRDGSRAITDWTSLGLIPSVQVFPTLDNSVGRGMLEVLEVMEGPMHGDGLYMDEVNYPSGMGWMGMPPCTYGVWDGYSAELDPNTFAIVKKMGYVNLLAGPFKRKLFERVAARGWVILGNGEPETGWENALGFPRHTECRTDPYPRAYESHLYSPVALVEDLSFEHKRRMLEFGVIDAFVRLGPESERREELIRRSYPLTAREIHAGWILGEERIITQVPGAYTWHESVRVRIYEFGSDGLLAAESETVAPAGIVEVPVRSEGMTIVERISE